MAVKTYEEEIAYITRKLQALINSGYVIKDNIGNLLYQHIKQRLIYTVLLQRYIH